MLGALFGWAKPVA